MRSNPKLLFIILLLLPCLAKAQYNSALGFVSDNDAYFPPLGDEYYTNGLDINYTNRNFNGTKPNAYTIYVGQKMFTPLSVLFGNPKDQDRPYAGYLYGGLDYEVFLTERNLLNLGIEAGTTGEDSGAQAFQEYLHTRLIPSFDDPMGWENQIGNEIGFRVLAGINRELYTVNTGTDRFIGSLQTSIGNQFLNGKASISYLAGNFQSFNQSVFNSFNTSGEKEFFWFVTPSAELIGYDATIDGARTSENPVTRTREIAVLTGETGAFYSKKHWDIKFSITVEGRRAEEQRKAHEYLTLATSYKFR